MEQESFKPNERALVVVAHPDDETIWMGGFILQHPELDWTIFSLCRASDSDRAPKFKRICEIYNAKAIITDVEDNEEVELKKVEEQIKQSMLDKIGTDQYEYLFTHGPNGEYGHPVHVAVNRAVKEMLSNKKLNIRTIFYFNYTKSKPGKRPSMKAKKDSDLVLPLTKATFTKKKHLQSEIHGYPLDGIDNSMCTNPEAFKIIKLDTKTTGKKF
jgi:hypothetical protein